MEKNTVNTFYVVTKAKNIPSTWDSHTLNDGISYIAKTLSDYAIGPSKSSLLKLKTVNRTILRQMSLIKSLFVDYSLKSLCYLFPCCRNVELGYTLCTCLVCEHTRLQSGLCIAKSAYHHKNKV